ncbi:hypothetical protein, partial [Neisseria zoodegmatis]
AELARAAELQSDKVYKIERRLSDLRPTLADVADELQGVATKPGGLAYVGREAVKFESAMAGGKKGGDGTPGPKAGMAGGNKSMAGGLGLGPGPLGANAPQGGHVGHALVGVAAVTEMTAKKSGAV